MSRPPTSKLHRRCFSSWMPQESRNNLVQQKKNKKKPEKKQKRHKGEESESEFVSGGKKCVWRAVLQQCSCHTICPPVMGVLFSRPEQHAQTEAGAFFFFKTHSPPTPAHQHAKHACLCISRADFSRRMPDGIWGVSRNVRVTQQVWKPTYKAVRWHVVWSLHYIRVPYEGVWIHKCICMEVFGKTKRKKKNSNNSRGMPLAVPCSISYNISVPF